MSEQHVKGASFDEAETKDETKSKAEKKGKGKEKERKKKEKKGKKKEKKGKKGKKEKQNRKSDEANAHLTRHHMPCALTRQRCTSSPRAHIRQVSGCDGSVQCANVRKAPSLRLKSDGGVSLWL